MKKNPKNLGTSAPGQLPILGPDLKVGHDCKPLITVDTYHLPSSTPNSVNSWSELSFWAFFKPRLNVWCTLSLEKYMKSLILPKWLHNPYDLMLNVSLVPPCLIVIFVKSPHYVHSCVFPIDFNEYCPVGCIRKDEYIYLSSLIKTFNEKAFSHDLYINDLSEVN